MNQENLTFMEVPSNGKHNKILFDGHYLIYDRTNTKSGKKYYRCKRNDCKFRLHTLGTQVVEIVNSHNHRADPIHNYRTAVIQNIKNNAEDTSMNRSKDYSVEADNLMLRLTEIVKLQQFEIRTQKETIQNLENEKKNLGLNIKNSSTTENSDGVNLMDINNMKLEIKFLKKSIENLKKENDILRNGSKSWTQNLDQLTQEISKASCSKDGLDDTETKYFMLDDSDDGDNAPSLFPQVEVSVGKPEDATTVENCSSEMQEEKYNFQNFPQKLSLASYNNSEFAFPNLNFTPKNNKTAKKSSASSETEVENGNKTTEVVKSSNSEKRSSSRAMAIYNNPELTFPNLSSTDNFDKSTTDSPLEGIESTKTVTILKSMNGKAKAYSDGFIYNHLAQSKTDSSLSSWKCEHYWTKLKCGVRIEVVNKFKVKAQFGDHIHPPDPRRKAILEMKSSAYEEIETNTHLTPYQIAESAIKRLPMTVACTIQPNEVKAFRRSCYRHRTRVENKNMKRSALQEQASGKKAKTEEGFLQTIDSPASDSYDS